MQDVSKRSLSRISLALIGAGAVLAMPAVAAAQQTKAAAKTEQIKKPQTKVDAAKSKTAKQAKVKQALRTKTVAHPPARPNLVAVPMPQARPYGGTAVALPASRPLQLVNVATA